MSVEFEISIGIAGYTTLEPRQINIGESVSLTSSLSVSKVKRVKCCNSVWFEHVFHDQYFDWMNIIRLYIWTVNVATVITFHFHSKNHYLDVRSGAWIHLSFKVVFSARVYFYLRFEQKIKEYFVLYINNIQCSRSATNWTAKAFKKRNL